MNNTEKKKLIATMAVALTLLVGVTVSYAFIAIFGNIKNQEVSVGTGSIHITFSDNDTGVSGELSMGQSITKEFTIKNDGDGTGIVQINWDKLTNTYIPQSLTYTLEESKTKGGTYTKIPTYYKNVPDSGTKPLSRSISIPKGSTYYYRLTIKLEELKDTNQESDLEAVLATKFSLTNSTETASEYTLAHLNQAPWSFTPDFETKSPYNMYEVVEGERIDVQDPSDYFAYSDMYTFDKKNGKFSLVSPKICKYSECFENLINSYVILGYGYRTESAAQNNMKKSHNVIYRMNSTTAEGKLTYTTIEKSEETILSTEDSGIYSMEDDYGMSYYYRGAVENNYVKFAGLYWRIIRINGDGSIRMLYDGTSPHPNGNNTNNSDRFITTEPVNWVTLDDYQNNHDAKYVGYMYGGSSKYAASISNSDAQENKYDSDVKVVVDNWYRENIDSKGYTKYVGDELFCNDRSVQSNVNAFGTNRAYFEFYYRSGFPISPMIKCSQKNDRFTVDDETIGNGDLTYPVGLLAGDEWILAGSGNRENSLTNANLNFYLYKGDFDIDKTTTVYWTMSPMQSKYETHAFVPDSNSNSQSSGVLSYRGLMVAPVINIKPEYALKLTGDGSIDSPYLIPGVN